MIEILVSRPQSEYTRVLSSYESRVPLAGGYLETECLSSRLLALDNSGFVNQKLDLYQDFDLLVTRSIADIREPWTRQGDWSKTVTLPGTKNNNEIFGHIFEVEQTIVGSGQFAPDFNPNLKAECVVLVDGLEQVKGFLRVIQINVTDTDLIEYECAIFGTTADFFAVVENAKLNELDFSEYNHTLNIANVEASWDTYIYKDAATASFSYGEGYVYPIVYPPKQGSTTSSVETLSDEDNYPALYAKTIIDKIFSNAGYFYTSDSFFNTDRFKRLIVPWTNQGLEIDEATAANYLFSAQQNAGVTGATIALGGQFLFTNEISDPGNDYSTGTSTYTADQGGQYTFYHKLDGTIAIPGGGIAGTIQQVSVGVGVYVNGTRVATITHKDTGLTLPNTWGLSSTNSATISIRNGDAVTLKLDSIVSLEDVGAALQGYNQTSFTLTSTDDSEFYNAINAQTFAHGSVVDFSRFFGQNKQSEFFMGICNLFNLYIEQDYLSAKTLRIVPRDDFYNGDNRNWTNKLDYSQAYSIVPMGEVVGNPYVLTYKEGGDLENKRYQEIWGGTYGDRVIRVENDFIKQEKRIETCFIPTPIYRQNGRYYSWIQYENTNASDLRLLYYGGLQSCQVYFTRNVGESLTQNSRSSYPLTLHIDSVTNMQFDLSYGMPYEVNVPAGFSYSNQNVGNVYWYRYLTEIADKNSKVFRGYFRISPGEWATLKFKDNYFFEGQYWRLLSVNDYNPLSDGVFECEFLLSKYIEPVAGVNKGVGTNTSDTYDNRYPLVKNKPLQNGGVVIGGGNDTDEQVIVLGQDNQVNGERNVVLGSTGTYVAPGLDNVVVLNSEGLTPTESNTTYYGNYKMWATWLSAGKITPITHSDSPYSATDADWLLLCDTTSGNIDVVLPDPTNNSGKMYVIKKTQATNQINITAGDGSILIDDSTSHSSNSKNGYDQVVSDGTQYWIITHGH